MSQPKWKTEWATDYSRLLIDETDAYSPELEIAQEWEDDGKTRFQVYRFSLDRLVEVESAGKKVLVTARIAGASGLPYPLPKYEEWFTKNLASIATTNGTTVAELTEGFTSEDASKRAWAYECVGGHHGFDNLDSDPLTLTEKELNKRWK